MLDLHVANLRLKTTPLQQQTIKTADGEKNGWVYASSHAFLHQQMGNEGRRTIQRLEEHTCYGNANRIAECFEMPAEPESPNGDDVAAEPVFPNPDDFAPGVTAM